MSDRLSPQQLDELCDLIAALHEKCITAEQQSRLEGLVCRDEEACRVYVQYMHLYANLRWRKMNEVEFEPSEPSFGASASGTPILGFLGDVAHHGLDFLSRGLVLSLLLAVGLPAAVLLVLFWHVANQPTPPARPSAVAIVARTHECVWSDGETPLVAGTSLLPGRRVRLDQGLVELVFADGARVIVEGPSNFETGASEGLLQDGRLVAHVPKGAEGFTIKTPAATVVDYGTEFGVWFEADRATAEVHVFKGEVALETRDSSRERPSSARRQLTAGVAARVESVGTNGKVVIRQIEPLDELFVRSLPREPKAEIVADFSGGHGISSIDQFPGMAGEGWATGWNYREAPGIKTDITVERTQPLRDGGDYLSVSLKRESGSAPIRRTLQRRLELNDRVDLTKRHVVSFDFRFDELKGFMNRTDHVLICNHARSENNLAPTPTSGWHIRVDATDYKQVKARNWAFISGDGRGAEVRMDSGIQAVEGTVYSFRVLVDPQARQWTPSISIDGGPWTTFEPMGMRAKGTAWDCGYWPYLYLWWCMKGGNQGEEQETIRFSVDSFRIRPADD